ncbi:MAG: hypothetical protein ABFC38_00410 [Methanospirillum sp.]
MSEAESESGQEMPARLCPTLDSWAVPEHPLVTPLPYYPGLAEYAAIVRNEIVRRRDRSFAIAVDLPHGLEKPVLEAVKELPVPSLIIDQLSRGIAVLPSSAPIEAVRSYLEFGFELRFIDASLPVTGSMFDYQTFIQACRRFGIKTVLGDPLSYGVHPEELFHSYTATDERPTYLGVFAHNPDVYLRREAAPYDQAAVSPYLRTRLAYMAEKVRELEGAGVEILLVCDARYMDGILHHLTHESDPVDDTYVVPTRTIRLHEVDVHKVSEEVPFFAYLYELYRDSTINRRTWIQQLVREASGLDDACNPLCDTIAYAEKVALMQGDSVPDLAHLAVAAKMICGDEFTLSLVAKALTYPPAEESLPADCTRSLWVFMGRVSPLGMRPGNLDSSLRVLDFNFMPVRGFQLTARGWREVLGGGRGRGNLEQQLITGNKRNGWYSRWKRMPESYKSEREFTNYVLGRFPADSVSDEDWYPVEYSASLELGLDLRECLRYSHLDRIYVKRPDAVGNACYIFDYRGYRAQRSSAVPVETGRSLSHFFLDRYFDWAGLGVYTPMHYDSVVMAMFTRLTVPVTDIFTTIDDGNPLASTVSLGLEHCDQVIVFTDRPEEMGASVLKTGRVVRRPLRAIPAPVLNKMAAFDISHYRFDSTRGD